MSLIFGVPLASRAQHFILGKNNVNVVFFYEKEGHLLGFAGHLTKTDNTSVYVALQTQTDYTSPLQQTLHYFNKRLPAAHCCRVRSGIANQFLYRDISQRTVSRYVSQYVVLFWLRYNMT